MKDIPESMRSKEERWKDFREKHKQHKKESLQDLCGMKWEDLEIVDVLTQWPPVNMKEVYGTENWIGPTYDRYYTNTQWAPPNRNNRSDANIVSYLKPKTYYPPSIINNYGKDMAQNAQGIYYYNSFEEERVPANRDIFIPSFENIDWDGQTEARRRKRARIVEEHMVNNETFHKSEYAWEADAWSDIFGVMRDDNRLAM